jgi:predicted glutamine amidotransferase
MDINNTFTALDRTTIINRLAIMSEVRGTDATGFAYNHNDYLHIVKQPVPARRMKFELPDAVKPKLFNPMKSKSFKTSKLFNNSNTSVINQPSAPSPKVIIGHTRMTTQGNEKYNYNNHPFFGRTTNSKFALVHNGIIHNDKALRMQLKLPKTKIETDTYIAVQLLEQQNKLSFDSIKQMAERVKGIFTFAILDDLNNVWLVKGDNPVCIYRSLDYRFIIFSSTDEIMKVTLMSLGMDKLRYEKIIMHEGEILKISEDGRLERGVFEMDWCMGYGGMGYGFNHFKYRGSRIEYGYRELPNGEWEWVGDDDEWMTWRTQLM